MAYIRCPLSFYLTIMNHSKNREKGNIAEELACKYIEKQGYIILERNYLRKWGEIDIICLKDEKLHFFEVKSTFTANISNGHKPEDNVHNLKVKRLKRIIQTYLNENKINTEQIFEFHIAIVQINRMKGETNIEILKNIIL